MLYDSYVSVAWPLYDPFRPLCEHCTNIVRIKFVRTLPNYCTNIAWLNRRCTIYQRKSANDIHCRCPTISNLPAIKYANARLCSLYGWRMMKKTEPVGPFKGDKALLVLPFRCLSRACQIQTCVLLHSFCSTCATSNGVPGDALEITKHLWMSSLWIALHVNLNPQHNSLPNESDFETLIVDYVGQLGLMEQFMR